MWQVRLKKAIPRLLKCYVSRAQKQQRAHEDCDWAGELLPGFFLTLVCDGHGRKLEQQQQLKRLKADFPVDQKEKNLSFAEECLIALRLELATALSSVDRTAGTEHMQRVIGAAFLRVDERLFSKYSNTVFGSTCTGLLLDRQTHNLFTMNVGDSRCILFDEDTGMLLSETVDHACTTGLPAELARVRAAGGYIVCNRVDGILNITRSLGDYYLKKTCENVWSPTGKISAEPDVVCHPCRCRPSSTSCKTLCALLVSDGALDYVKEKQPFKRSSQELITKFAASGADSLAAECQSLLDDVAPTTTDDVTIVALRLGKPLRNKKKDKSFVAKKKKKHFLFLRFFFFRLQQCL